MNMQSHMSGQVSGQVPNSGGMISQQNGNVLQHAQMPNLGAGIGGVVVPHSGGGSGVGPSRNLLGNLNHESVRMRQFMRTKIFNILQQRHPLASDDSARARLMDVARRLEEGLMKMATSKEDYMDPRTLESRLGNLIKQFTTQRHANSSASAGTMIPTPGTSHGRNPNLTSTSTVDTSMIASGCNNIAATDNTGSVLPTSGLHGGNLSNGYLQSSAGFSNGSGVKISSVGAQRMASQMIPTPGFSNNSADCNGQSHVNMEMSSNGGGCSAVESPMVPQSQQQRQHTDGQESRILHSLGSQISAGFRSGSQHRSYGSMNGSLNGGSGMHGNSVQLVNEPRTSEGFLGTTSYANSGRPLCQSFDHLQQPRLHGEGYAMSNSNSFGSGNFYGAVTSAGSMTNTQSMNSVNLKSISRANSSVVNNQSNLNGMQQVAQMKPEPVDQFENANFQRTFPPKENLPQESQQQRFQQQHKSFQHHHQQEQSIDENVYGRSQLASDVVTQLKCEPGSEHHNEVLQSQFSEQYQLSRLQNRFQQNFAGDCYGGAHSPSVPTGQHDMCSSLPQHSQQIQQMVHPQHLPLEARSDNKSFHAAVQSKSVQSQWPSQLQDWSQLSENSNGHVEENFCQRILGQCEAEHNNFTGVSVNDQNVVPRSRAGISNPPKPSGASIKSRNENCKPMFENQQRFLIFLHHAKKCSAPKGMCKSKHCLAAQQLLEHVKFCKTSQCTARCRQTTELLRHYRYCKEPACPVCVPVKKYLQRQAAGVATRLKSDSVYPNSNSGPCNSFESRHDRESTDPQAHDADLSAGLQPSLKRLKVEESSPSVAPETESSAISGSANTEANSSQDVHLKDYQHGDICTSVKAQVMEMNAEVSDVSGQGNLGMNEMKKDISEDTPKQMPGSELVMHDGASYLPKQENVKLEKEIEPPKGENIPSADIVPGTKSGKPKIKGVSLTELFTPEQVREHIRGLRQWIGQSKAKAEKNQAMERSMTENSCQLCAVEKLTFEPPPIYCSPCGARIKRNATYYTAGAGDTRHYFCIPCYNETRGDTIVVDGTSIPKARLEKKKNDEETEEWWVQCDKCEAWQHQICALFNGRRNDGGQAEYTCPNCYIEEVERGERKPLPQSAVLGAKDLPRTILSDHIEQRLFSKLKQERQERARVQGKSYDEVPGAEALVVRVVSSVDKKLEVKPRFLELFKEENYPTEFPYKSKAVLLFQNIEGVEVCLFGMYVQEFGSESEFPNQRRVYLSYLDSVKYFRPEVKTVTGEALRTFVYHEILIGYLEYCKKRGFTSCYIWACPPLKGEDYILYCHPEIQKTPKSDKLREWYLSMLRKAAKETIVVECTNLYDHFFIQTGECRSKVTAARLPYFDGDYWPGAAEDLIYQMSQEDDGKKLNKKGSMKKTISKRALKASGYSDLSANASKDLLLMHKLGETISPMKEDFIMVHLQYCCTHCCILMVSGIRWFCRQCKNFCLCEKCYEVEQKREERERHPVNQKEKHALYLVEISDVPADTKDKDEILESEFFDTRQAFLSLCQGNHYQYDTLRRAKHSSMMMLYHLHNPTAPAFVTTCNMCLLDIETGQGWRCDICPDYDVCNACYSKGISHPHKLMKHPTAERDAQNKEARQLRVLQLRKMLDLLVHASQCRSPLCQYPNCRRVKGLFRHGIQCRVRASGGCHLCKKMWYLLQLHARACKESQCHVPRCRDLKEHVRRLQQQSDSRRRAAVMEMMRQRAAEVASTSG